MTMHVNVATEASGSSSGSSPGGGPRSHAEYLQTRWFPVLDWPLLGFLVMLRQPRFGLPFLVVVAVVTAGCNFFVKTRSLLPDEHLALGAIVALLLSSPRTYPRLAVLAAVLAGPVVTTSRGVGWLYSPRWSSCQGSPTCSTWCTTSVRTRRNRSSPSTGASPAPSSRR